MIYQLRFTEAAVVANPELLDAAIQWVKGYDGDNLFLLRAKKEAHAAGDLSPKTARRVLNYMRLDECGSWYLPTDSQGFWLGAKEAPELRRVV